MLTPYRIAQITVLSTYTAATYTNITVSPHLVHGYPARRVVCVVTSAERDTRHPTLDPGTQACSSPYAEDCVDARRVNSRVQACDRAGPKGIAESPLALDRVDGRIG